MSWASHTPHPGSLPVEGLSMAHIFSAGHRCPARTNPKSETRNPKQAPNSNDKFSKPDQLARPRLLGFADLLLCSLEFVSDFGFRISDFGSCPPLLPKRRCPAEENVGKDQCSSGEGRGEGSIAAQHVRFLCCFIIVRCSANILRGFSKGDL